MNHSRIQHTLIRVVEPDTGTIQSHTVKRSDASKWLASFRRNGFEIVAVLHDYNEEK